MDLIKLEKQEIGQPIFINHECVLNKDVIDYYDTRLKTINFLGKTVLDIGCNLGYTTYKAKRLGALYCEGFDIDEELIQYAKELYECENIVLRGGLDLIQEIFVLIIDNFLENTNEETKKKFQMMLNSKMQYRLNQDLVIIRL